MLKACAGGIWFGSRGGRSRHWTVVRQSSGAGALMEYLRTNDRMAILKKGGPLWIRHDQGADAVETVQPLSAWGFARRMKEYAHEAGIGHFHLHQTRHTFARIVAESSGSIIETHDALGHRNPATTRVYVQRIAVKRDNFGEEIAKRMKL